MRGRTGRKRLLRVFLLLPGFLLLLALALWFCTPNGSEFQVAYPRVTALMRQQGQGPEAAPEPVPLGKISPWLVHLVLMAEDDRFFLHQGLDWKSLQQALETNIRRHRWAVGGSGITQQLSKNLYWGGARSLWRKAAEGLSAIRMERALGKRRILELYLNVIEWGPGIYGIGRASRRFLGKPASDIGVEEAIRLASILPNPRRFTLQDQGARMVRKRRILARRLLQKGLLTRQEWKKLDAKLSS